MATSLVHIGDFHAAPGPRNADRYRALDQVIDEALQLPALGAFLWPGDLNHRIGVRLEIEDQNALIARLRRMSAVAPVVLVYGNHDVAGDLDKFAEAANGNPIYVVDRPQVLRIRLATMEFASIACLPYPHKHGLVLAGVANPDLVDEAANALDAIFMQFDAELAAARDRGDLTLFIGHANVGGAITSSGQPNIGKEIELSPRHLDRLGPIYKGLNHIHKGQEILGAHYPGSICRLDWGEIEEKRWLEVEYYRDADDVAPAPARYSVRPHQIDVAPMYHVEGQLTREGFTWACTAGPGGELQDAPASWKGCEVRCRYRFNAAEIAVLNKSLVLADFAEAKLLQLDPIAEKDHALRAPEVAAAKTLPDKVAAWCELAGVVATEGVLRKLAKLEQISDIEVHVDAARDWAGDIAAGDADEQRATVAA